MAVGQPLIVGIARFALAVNSASIAALAAAHVGWVLLSPRAEEPHLREEYGDGYDRYASPGSSARPRSGPCARTVRPDGPPDTPRSLADAPDGVAATVGGGPSPSHPGVRQSRAASTTAPWA